jgi:hypothetical protein
MAEFSSQIAPNFVSILWISQTGLDRGYSQYIKGWQRKRPTTIYGVCHNLQKSIIPFVELANQ